MLIYSSLIYACCACLALLAQDALSKQMHELEKNGMSVKSNLAAELQTAVGVLR